MYKGICKICSKPFIARRKSQFLCSLKCHSINRRGAKLSKEARKKMSIAHLANPVRYWLGKKRPSTSGKKHHNWKNGKANNGDYVILRMPYHPFCNSHGYIMEHRIVMEKHIKRYLKPKERIHHINGIKNDNQIKNLMLFPNQGVHMNFHRHQITHMNFHCLENSKQEKLTK